MVEDQGLEPWTCCVQNSCSPSELIPREMERVTGIEPARTGMETQRFTLKQHPQNF